jgi:hypothetical protein
MAETEDRPEQLATEERQHGIATALQLIGAGLPHRAHHTMLRTVERQFSIAGLGRVTLSPTCPCLRCAPAALRRQSVELLGAVR